ncbi:Gfo/Idh/MocA family protein [uncultured Megasphaera sp.]|uniref:Gfo/Idh/MocA family protein n=1 Tax=uncultured Megasphaera sp. TaxID=165188 RepID=UPI0025DE378F|nr:Gfo/Idh/MocA family oxidoreductase [uncultured Megasphaera sp.]
MKKIIRVGLIGAGFIGRSHATAYVNQCQFESDVKVDLRVVCDPVEAAAKALADSHGFSRYTTDWKEVVAADDVDLVCICTPNNMHCEIAKEAARHGKHINCEKPLGMDGNQSEDAARVIKECGVVAACGFNTMKTPVIAYAKQVIDSGRLGQLVSFRGSYDTDGLATPDAPHAWRMLAVNSKLGSMGDLAAHVLSISQYLLGDITAVSGMTRIVYDKRKNAKGEYLPVENDDVAQFLCTYENGGIGYISSNRVAPGCKQAEVFEAQFTKGTIRWSLERMNEINIYYTDDAAGDQGFKNIISAPEHGEYGKFWAGPGIGIGYEDLKTIEEHHLLENIVNGTKPVADFVFAAKIDRVMEAVLESAQNGQWTKVKAVNV